MGEIREHKKQQPTRQGQNQHNENTAVTLQQTVLRPNPPVRFGINICSNDPLDGFCVKSDDDGDTRAKV